jgi:hypothetical protein
MPKKLNVVISGSIAGTGVKGEIVYFYDENGDVIGSPVVGDDGTFSSCDVNGENPTVPIGPDDITVGTVNPDNGGVSVPKQMFLMTFETQTTPVSSYSVYESLWFQIVCTVRRRIYVYN